MNRPPSKRKSRTKKKCAFDRLSELPDSLIFNIYRLLPVTDVVRTTILSKRWGNLWTTLPWLDFYDGKKINTDKFRNLIDGALNSWRGINIVRFWVKFDCKPDKSLTSDHIDSWMRFAMEKKVEELKLVFPYRYKVSDEDLYLVPQYLYSCSSLKDLCLRSCDLQIHGNVQWDQLKILSLLGEGLSENAINQVLCGSPRLETLSLTLYDSKENLTIRSSSLRKLSVGKFLYYHNDAPSMETELRIWTPALKTLFFDGVPYRKCLLMDVSSLSAAFLEFDDVSSGNDFVGETLSQILPKIKHVHHVSLSNWCIKALGDMKEKHIPLPFPFATYLKLKVCSKEYEQIVGVLEMFPKLKHLVLETTYNSKPNPVESCLKSDINLPCLFLRYLRTIDVTWSNGDDSIFPLIQILLKYARNLGKMVFSRDKANETRTPWKSLYMALKKLQKMMTSSTAELIFRDNV